MRIRPMTPNPVLRVKSVLSNSQIKDSLNKSLQIDLERMKLEMNFRIDAERRRTSTHQEIIQRNFENNRQMLEKTHQQQIQTMIYNHERAIQIVQNDHTQEIHQLQTKYKNQIQQQLSNAEQELKECQNTNYQQIKKLQTEIENHQQYRQSQQEEIELLKQQIVKQKQEAQQQITNIQNHHIEEEETIKNQTTCMLEKQYSDKVDKLIFHYEKEMDSLKIVNNSLTEQLKFEQIKPIQISQLLDIQLSELKNYCDAETQIFEIRKSIRSTQTENESHIDQFNVLIQELQKEQQDLKKYNSDLLYVIEKYRKIFS